MPDEARDGRNIALKWKLEVKSHLLACLIVQNNHPTINSSMPNNFNASAVAYHASPFKVMADKCLERIKAPDVAVRYIVAKCCHYLLMVVVGLESLAFSCRGSLLYKWPECPGVTVHSTPPNILSPRVKYSRPLYPPRLKYPGFVNPPWFIVSTAILRDNINVAFIFCRTTTRVCCCTWRH